MLMVVELDEIIVELVEALLPDPPVVLVLGSATRHCGIFPPIPKPTTESVDGKVPGKLGREQT